MWHIEDFSEHHTSSWEDLVRASWNGTFLLTRRYLSYHRNRFTDASVVVRDTRGSVRGVLPAAVDPDVPDRLISHPGLTYGGLVHAGKLVGSAAREAMEAISAHYRSAGFRGMRYKPVPDIFHARRTADDLHALHVLGATRVRADLASVVDLRANHRLAQARLYELGRARRANLVIIRSPEAIAALWPVVTESLQARHQVSPTHTVDEMATLARLFEDRVHCTVALSNGEVVAGAVVFETGTCDHTQYLATSPEGRRLSALDLVIDAVVESARSRGTRYVGFGISTELGGLRINDGLYAYKRGFGAGSLCFEAYDWQFQ